VAVVRFGSHSKGSFTMASVDFSEAWWFMGGVVPLLRNENMYTGLSPWLFWGGFSLRFFTRNDILYAYEFSRSCILRHALILYMDFTKLC